MPLINKHEEEIPVETDGVSVGPGGGYCRVFRESAQRSGAVEKIRNQLGLLAEIHTGGQWNLLQSTVNQRKYYQMG